MLPARLTFRILIAMTLDHFLAPNYGCTNYGSTNYGSKTETCRLNPPQPHSRGQLPTLIFVAECSCFFQHATFPCAQKNIRATREIDPIRNTHRKFVMIEKDTTKKHLLITGSTIGIALAEAFAADDQVASVTLTWRSHRPVVSSPKITTKQLDLTDEAAVSSTFKHLERLDGVINAVGFLHGHGLQPEKSISRASSATFFKNMEANTLPTVLLAKHSRHLLKGSPAAFFTSISAKVGSIEDNRLGGWYSYRASKAALNMILKTLSIEWSFALPKCPVAALHPGTVVSRLSEPFTKHGHRQIFSPEESASHLKKILDNLTPQQTGRFWSWDGTEIPW